MKKNVWILNHYAATMMAQRGGRHYWMAKELKKKGYHPVIFCANVLHNSNEIIETDGIYTAIEQDGIVFVVVKLRRIQETDSAGFAICWDFIKM